MSIKILNTETVSRIAAGEVIERPASIIKELVENSIDAGSTSITIEIREGGIDYIRVTDNGHGIAPDDVRLAFMNHATSKLQNGDMLTDIRTLGFRGEALPSIAAVSKVEMRTRIRNSETGIEIKVEGGNYIKMNEVGCAEGTSVTVRDLFYNLPARRAFLKRPATEAGAASDIVTKLILGNPQVSIRFINNGRTVYHSFGDNKMETAALAVMGRDIAASMKEIDAYEGAFRISGLIGIGELARPNRSMQYFFINGRTVKCGLLTAALEQAAKERVGIGMHPICALHVRIPAASVDVNVHPSKLEVRFRDEVSFRSTAESLLIKELSKGDAMLDINHLVEEKNQLIDKLSESVDLSVKKETTELSAEEKLAFAKEYAAKQGVELKADEDYFAAMRRPVPEHSPFLLKESECEKKAETSEEDTRSPEAINDPVRSETVQIVHSGHTEDHPISVQADSLISTVGNDENCLLKSDLKPKYRVIGIVLHTYLLLEALGSLIIIDQHAAHERILFERFKKQMDLGIASQKLLIPIIISMTQREIAVIEENSAILEEVGYEVSRFGEREISVRAVPMILGKADYKALFAEMIDDLIKLKDVQMSERIKELVSFSCRKAIKGGDPLSDAEVEALVDTMLESGAPPTCPHGRPVAKVITGRELEKMFWRV